MADQTTMSTKFSPLVLLFLLSLSSYKSIESRSTLSKGSSLSVEDTSDVLTSPDNTFTCGFFHVDGSNAYWFSIWFTNTIEKTVVWMANRDNPVYGRGSRLKLHHDSEMVLTDVDGSTAWQTNTSSTNVDHAELLNSGNLVLRDPSGNILWQSFDYPTDTLLPNQIFTKDTKLTSRMGKQMFASGYFFLVFDNDNVLKLIYNGPEMANEYWPDPDNSIYVNGRTNYNSSRVAVLDDSGRFLSSDSFQFSAADMGSGIKRRLTMDYDGNFRLYSLNLPSGSWIITWEAVTQQCNVHGLCGRNGICVYGLEAKSSCPPYYEPVNSTDWTKGCKPKFERSCSDSQLLELLHVDYYGFDLNYINPTMFENCKQLCLNNCQCQAFGYRITGSGQCWLKGDLFNGYRSPNFPGNMYIRLPKDVEPSEITTLSVSELACGSGEPMKVINHRPYAVTSDGSQWVYWYSAASSIGAVEILILGMVWWFLVRQNEGPSSAGYRAILSQFRSFSCGELKAATGKFKEVIGRGSFGVVYRGLLEDDRVVAVKRLGDVVRQGEEDFWAEVSTIGKINHINLVRMWGFCSEGNQRLLVYEYVENGSLDKHLFSMGSLAWEDRYKVAFGTARGLAYLHHECLEWVIHCDIKPENILLDSDFQPKISDFGLAKLSQRDGTGSIVTRIRGTNVIFEPLLELKIIFMKYAW